MKSSKTVKTVVLAVLILAAVAALSVGITLTVVHSARIPCAVCTCCSKSSSDVSKTAEEQQNESTGTAEVQHNESTVQKDPASISIPGFDFLNLRADTKEQNLSFLNPSENSCYFRISLLLDGEALWRSELLAPGQSTEKQVLNRSLAVGNYNAVLKYECFADEAETDSLNGSEIELPLHVQ